MSEYDSRKDVRYTVFVTSNMDNDISNMAELMGLSKMDYIRMCLAQSILGYKTGIEAIKTQYLKDIE